jgi:IS30 family transposase
VTTLQAFVRLGLCAVLRQARVAQMPIREIAKRLQQAVSTVSREVARHGGRPQYRASDADSQAWSRLRDPRRAFSPLT